MLNINRSSFVIPCNNNQADIIISTVAHIQNQMTGYAISALTKPAYAEHTLSERIIVNCHHLHHDFNPSQPATPLDWGFLVEKVESGVHLFHDQGNTMHQAVFTQAVLSTLDLPDCVVIQGVESGEGQSGGAFNAHFYIVTKNSIKVQNIAPLIEAELEAHKTKARYFKCSITEVNGEIEYLRDFLMVCDEGVDPDGRFDEIFLNYRGEAVSQENDNFVWYADGLAGTDPEMIEISAHEFQVMQRHLSVK